MKKSNNNTNSALHLRANSLKATSARVSLLDLLVTESRPLTADEIHGQLSGNMNTTTVYRILEQLVQKGIVYQTNFRDGKAYYEFQTKHHHHIACTLCGLKEQVSVCVSSLLPTLLKNSKQFNRADDHILEFFGVCKSCTV